MQNLNTVIGNNLKRIRDERSLSLDRVAEMTGVSKSMLGQIERGEANPSITTIWKIANGLRVSFSSFTKEEALRVSVVTSDQIEPVTGDDRKYRVYSIFPFDIVKHFEIYRLEMESGCVFESEAHFKGVEEYITVFTGELQIKVGNKTYSISAGDSINFPGDQPHVYSNKGCTGVVAHMLIHYPS